MTESDDNSNVSPLLRDADETVSVKIPARGTARWLLLPVAFSVGHWWLLLQPQQLVDNVPILWSLPENSSATILPPIPQTRSEAYAVGAEFMYYTIHCSDPAAAREKPCLDSLARAGKDIHADNPLTEEQLFALKGLLAELDAQQSIWDRVLGFFNFVNILWICSIVILVGTTAPCLAYFCGPILLQLLSKIYDVVLFPLGLICHRWGVFELVAYMLAFAVSVQSSRYPAGPFAAGMYVAFASGLAFLPCWFYSTALHMGQSGGNREAFLALTGVLFGSIMVPLALIHHSSVLGFVAVLAAYAAIGFSCGAFGFGFYIGFESQDAMTRCLSASVVLMVTFTSFRMAGMNPSWTKPFAMGAMILGNVMYFLALLILSGGYRSVQDNYVARQAIMLVSLLAALAIGSVWSITSMTSIACTFSILYAMEKELEIHWAGMGPVILFFNAALVCWLCLWLNNHPGYVVAMFDPSGLYT